MKQHVIEDIQASCDKFDNIFLFSVDNMRNGKLKDVRMQWKDSRFFFGKNRVMQLGLRRVVDNEDEDTKKTLTELCDRLTGQCGLLFTNHERQVVLDWFESFTDVDFARSGFKALETIVLPEGKLEEFSHAIEPHLRKLGMPTKLERGIVTLYKEFTVCETGQVLTPEQARILKLLCRPIAEFKMNVECCWTKDGGFQLFKERSKKSASKFNKKQLKKDKKNKLSKKKIAAEAEDNSDEEEVVMETSNVKKKESKKDKKKQLKKKVAAKSVDSSDEAEAMDED